MNRTIVFPVILLLLAGAGFHCKPYRIPPSTLLTGKLVIDGPCGNYVIQVLSGNVDSAKILASWKDSIRDTTYSNVFTASNICTVRSYSLVKNDIFTFRMTDSIPVHDCPICLIAIPMPGIFDEITDVQKIQSK
jgi:hypothetical protein